MTWPLAHTFGALLGGSRSFSSPLLHLMSWTLHVRAGRAVAADAIMVGKIVGGSDIDSVWATKWLVRLTPFQHLAEVSYQTMTCLRAGGKSRVFSMIGAIGVMLGLPANITTHWLTH